MGKIIDLTDKKYSRLTVKNKSGVSKYGKVLWLCKCTCGKETIVPSGSLNSGSIRSCGCLQKEFARINVKKMHKANVKHKMTKTKFYKTWGLMKQRCYNKKHPNYKHWGGRGIKVCERWLDFLKFKKDMYSGYLEHKKNNSYTSIDRIDNDGNYEPSNCRWATMSEQMLNTRSTLIK